MQFRYKNQSGISLIEILIAMALGLVLLSGIIQIFISNRTTSLMQESVARVQENGRVVMEYLAREIRAADYWGCATGIDTFTNHLDTTHPSYDPTLHDFSNTEGVAGTNNDGLNGSDTLTLSGLFGEELPIIQDMPETSAVVKVRPGNNVIAPGDIIFISNCKGGDIFQVTAGNPGSTGTVGHNSGGSVAPGNVASICNTTGASACPNCFCQKYGLEASLHVGFNISRYYLDLGSDGEPTLFVDDRFNPPMPLVSGIENFQVTYGEDTDGDGSANRYLEAGNPTLNMDNAVSLKVSLLVASTAEITEKPQTLRFNWEETLAKNSAASIESEAPDRRLRRSYTMTVSLRNRLD